MKIRLKPTSLSGDGNWQAASGKHTHTHANAGDRGSGVTRGAYIYLTHSSELGRQCEKAGGQGAGADAKMFMRIMNKRHVRAAAAA